MHITLPTVIAALAVAAEVSAAMMSPRSHHGMLARRINRKKRCIQRSSTVTPVENHASATSAPPPPQTYAPAPADNNNNNNNNNSNNNGGGNTGGYGTIQNAGGGQCGDPQASANPTADGGPNGLESWLNCGIDGGGWTPPPLTLSNFVHKSLEEALGMPGNPFVACTPHLQAFKDVAGQTGIPDILLASIALQESGCQQYVTGPNGEIGLMQITPDKCYGDCFDAATNIGIGGNYFKGVIDGAGGNIAQAMGEYNGWFVHMTVGDANNHPSCGSRNNLDYLQTVFNGFCQGIDPSSIGMGVWFNNSRNC